MAEFENLNNYSRMQFLVGNSPEEIQAQLSQIRVPIQIISMYGFGSKHIVWFLSDVRINKVLKKKEKQNG